MEENEEIVTIYEQFKYLIRSREQVSAVCAVTIAALSICWWYLLELSLDFVSGNGTATLAAAIGARLVVVINGRCVGRFVIAVALVMYWVLETSVRGSMNNCPPRQTCEQVVKMAGGPEEHFVDIDGLHLGIYHRADTPDNAAPRLFKCRF